MENIFHIEVGSHQRSHAGERICGDMLLSQKVKEESRTVVVLSDGMGHGVKANMLATLTAKMALSFTIEHKDVNKIAEIIMNTLPVCSERKISYSTFTIVDIEHDGQTTILNYDNPDAIVMRGDEKLELEWENILLDDTETQEKEINVSQFKAKKEDRIIITTDGITQSGLGKDNFLLGWGMDNLEKHIKKSLSENSGISASKLSATIVNKAHANDGYSAKDDMSSAVIYLREPRKLILASGPPYKKRKDSKLADVVNSFKGKKIICGGTTADILARELNREITDSLELPDPDLPPVSYMEGVDLITEGILTLSKVSNILEKYNERYELEKGPADQIVRMFLESDEIHFLIGTAINVAHQDPNLPVELEIRRSVVKKIAGMLEEKFLKEVYTKFI